MDEEKEKDEEKKKKEKKEQDIRSAYNHLIGLWKYNNDQIWSRTSVMLTANSIIIAAFVVFIVQPILPCFSLVGIILLDIIGISLCFIWAFFIFRTYKYFLYYLFSARELEQYLPEEVQFINKGRDLAEGRKVIINDPFKPLIKENPNKNKFRKWLMNKIRKNRNKSPQQNTVEIEMGFWGNRPAKNIIIALILVFVFAYISLTIVGILFSFYL